MISKIRQELKKHVDKDYREGATRYFKEPIKPYGVRAPIVRQIARKYWLSIKDQSKDQIFNFCEILLKSGYHEEAMIAFQWAYNLKKQYQAQDFKIFEKWLKKYVDNWGKCDDFCTHAFGCLLDKYPKFLSKIKIWAKSKNRWLRRASAVILIHPIKYAGHNYLKQVFEIADILLLDSDDLVQKGYGWTLKEASNIYPKEVFGYVIKNKRIMPRTALRYAIEKLPEKMRKKAMT